MYDDDFNPVRAYYTGVGLRYIWEYGRYIVGFIIVCVVVGFIIQQPLTALEIGCLLVAILFVVPLILFKFCNMLFGKSVATMVLITYIFAGLLLPMIIAGIGQSVDAFLLGVKLGAAAIIVSIILNGLCMILFGEKVATNIGCLYLAVIIFGPVILMMILPYFK